MQAQLEGLLRRRAPKVLDTGSNHQPIATQDRSRKKKTFKVGLKRCIPLATRYSNRPLNAQARCIASIPSRAEAIAMRIQGFQPSRKRTAVLCGVAITLSASILLFVGVEVQKRALDAVDRVNQVVVADRALVHLAIGMESNLRGYLATGDQAFLTPFCQSADSVDAKFEALNKLLAHEPAQQARRVQLHGLF